jgi:Bacteriophage tail sheath protein
MVNYLSPGVYVEEVPPLASPIAGVGTSTPGFIGVIPDTVQIPAYTSSTDSATLIKQGYKYVDFALPPGAAAASVNFLTTWSQFTKLYGNLLGDATAAATAVASPAVNAGQRNLAQAVYGFFNNGGTGCYVTRVAAEGDLQKALTVFAAIDDISMVAAPGLTSATDTTALIAHCALLEDRVAILDAVQTDAPATNFGSGNFTALENTPTGTPAGLRPSDSQYAAVYFPWIQVFDPGTQLTQGGSGLVYVPPSGHMAGIWARVDGTRGVYKAPANEVVQGAVGLQWSLATADQNNLNPVGVNLIRPLNGAIRVWGARTVGGNDNGNFKYLSTRRYFNYLRKSIQSGTQWVVFEPNSPSLWKRIVRSVDEFLLNEWHNGALFGDTPKQAYFVNCDANTNPQEVRDAGEVITEIGVAILQPAEFVIFRIQQTTGG